MQQAMDQEKALLLNTEIAAAVTAMRQNSKWAVVPRYTVRWQSRQSVPSGWTRRADGHLTDFQRNAGRRAWR